ncbi:MAG: 8-oxo-dGTP diphosphatase [Patescibacteria group bacterium]
MKQLTLVLVHQHPKVLLGLKKRGFGEGRWNGFGGKVEEGETVEEAARREVSEEVGLTLNDLDKVGILKFEFEDDAKELEVHLFRAEDISGEPMETEEMKPEWFHVDDIPFAQMWPDDIHWFPYFLERKKFKARFKFDKPSGSEFTSTILEQEINEVDEI